jgi:hypothetical protein
MLGDVWNQRTKRLLAYLVIAAAFLFAIFHVEGIAQEAKRAAGRAEIAIERLDAQVFAQCVEGNKGRQAIRQTFTDIINIATVPQPPVPGQPDLSDEQKAERKKRIDAFLKQFNDVLNNRLPFHDCDNDGDMDAKDGVLTQ